jgi:hypothetical protein
LYGLWVKLNIFKRMNEPLTVTSISRALLNSLYGHIYSIIIVLRGLAKEMPSSADPQFFRVKFGLKQHRMST